MHTMSIDHQQNEYSFQILINRLSVFFEEEKKKFIKKKIKKRREKKMEKIYLQHSLM